MRMVSKLLVAAILVIALSAPAIADQLPAPMEKIIFPGITHVAYAGQSFTFNTSVPMHISFVSKGFTTIELKFKVGNADGSRGGASQSSPDDQIAIYWNDWQVDVYNGPPPLEEWEGLLHTESGFTEK